MADAPAVGGGEGKLDFLKHKVGPLPIFVWILAFGAIYWYLSRRGGAGATDSAGNTGTIDPATGYVYGSTQDQAALAAHNSPGGAGSSSGTATDGSTTAGAYQDNGAWGRAAVNYLAGLGVDPSVANESIQQYLSSQPLRTEQQANVNLAIQALGPPPTLPGPTGVPVPPIVNPGPGTTYATNPPTGFVVAGKTNTTVSLKWNASSNARGYTVRYGKTSSATDGSMSVGSTTTSATIGGLADNSLYYFRVQATPAQSTAGFASVQTTTDSTPTSPPPPPGGGGGGSSTGSRTYTVQHGDTLVAIARKLGIADWHTLYNANKQAIEDAAHHYGHPSSNGGNLIFGGTVLHY